MARGDEESLTRELLRAWPLPEVEDHGDKHDRGTVLVVGGTAATPGAVLLAGLAALRVGAGRLQLATVPETAVALGVAVPEALVLGVPVEEQGQVSLEGVDAVLVGPGLSGDRGTRAVLSGLLPRLEDRPLVVDAGALHLLDDLPTGGLVLTPNLGELAAIDRSGGQRDEPLDRARRVAAERQAVVATQGWVVAPDGRAWRVETGGPGLATSGSGDVLAGMVVGLLARGADPCQAGCFGAYLHGTAGDQLSAHVGPIGYLARELLEVLPRELAGLSRRGAPGRRAGA